MASCPGYFETQPDGSTFIRNVLDLDIYEDKDHNISGAVMFTKRGKCPETCQNYSNKKLHGQQEENLRKDINMDSTH